MSDKNKPNPNNNVTKIPRTNITERRHNVIIKGNVPRMENPPPPPKKNK